MRRKSVATPNANLQQPAQDYRNSTALYTLRKDQESINETKAETRRDKSLSK
jgi:hypothetical protein